MPPTFDMATRVREPTGNGRPYSQVVVAVDAAGSSYIYGTLTGPVYIGGNMLAAGKLGTLGVPAATYVARLDAAPGNYQRGSTSTNNTLGIMTRFTADAQGGCYTTGTYAGRTSLGSHTLGSIGTGVPNEDVYVARLDAAGQRPGRERPVCHEPVSFSGATCLAYCGGVRLAPCCPTGSGNFRPRAGFGRIFTPAVFANPLYL